MSFEYGWKCSLLNFYNPSNLKWSIQYCSQFTNRWKASSDEFLTARKEGNLLEILVDILYVNNYMGHVVQSVQCRGMKHMREWVNPIQKNSQGFKKIKILIEFAANKHCFPTQFKKLVTKPEKRIGKPISMEVCLCSIWTNDLEKSLKLFLYMIRYLDIKCFITGFLCWLTEKRIAVWILWKTHLP